MKKVTIKGITDSTIAFNKINLILRGNSNNIELYPNSIAKNVEIQNEEQEKELLSLQKNKFIELIEEVPVSTVVTTSTVSETTITTNAPKKSESKKIKKINKSPVMSSEEGKPLVIKSECNESNVDFSMKNNKIDESILAAEKIEEENKLTLVIDESKLDASERMGNDVVISTGKNNHKKSPMKRSCVDGEDEIKKSDPFIDKDSKDIIEKKSEEVFIEKKDDTEDTSEAFIEV